MNPYEEFWNFLPVALLLAEARTDKRLAMSAIGRLKAIEAGGNRGYLNNNDPFNALNEFIAHVYDSAEIPFWLMSAERG